MAQPANFDRLAKVYRSLEFLAFGSALERARFCFLARVGDCRDILVLGEGDGRCLAQLMVAAPQARIHCVDASGAMLAQAAARAARGNVNGRVTFEKADVFSARFPPGHYDAVVTLFFLDCFSAEQVAALVAQVGASLRPGALWLWADFILPPRGWSRLRARLLLAGLYAFFRWETGLRVSSLPPSEQILGAAGFSIAESRDFQRGFIRSAVLKRPGIGA